jgi:hypothetical protein
MSEMRRAARSLVEHRTERFESRHSLDDSKARLAAGIARLGLKGSTRFDPAWSCADGKTVLDAHFRPAHHIKSMLSVSSLVMSALVLSSVWLVMAADEGAALKFLVPLFTGLAILAFPFVALALNSNRESEESRIRKAIRVALLDETEKLPPEKKWDDED